MNRTVQMQQLKMGKKTKTDTFQKLAKGHFRKERKKITLKKSQIEATAIMEIIKKKKKKIRSSHQRCSTKIGVLINFSKFSGKQVFCIFP